MSVPPPGEGGPELRIGDSERDAAVSALGEHYAAGRLSKQEFDERADVAWTARTRSALWPLFADLPHPTAPRPAMPPTTPRSPWAEAGRGPRRGRRVGFPVVPLLVVVFMLVVLGHPLVFLLLLVWLFWARTHGAWGSGRHRPHDRR